jgi:hypothetical protein
MSKRVKVAMTAIEIKARIAELEATPRALVGTDEGTHGQPLTLRIYEEITGERYATASFAGSNATRRTEESAQADTKGRIRLFPLATAEIRRHAAELKQLRLNLLRSV